jgi:hypothetical protein
MLPRHRPIDKSQRESGGIKMKFPFGNEKLKKLGHCVFSTSWWRLILIVAMFPGYVWSDALVGWDVSGVDAADIPSGSPYEFYATTNVDHVGGSLSLGSGVNPTTTAGQYGFKVSANDEQTTLEGAITENHYIEFILSIDSGYAIDLQSLEINGEASGTGCSNVVFMSSIDGFVAGNEIASFLSINGDAGGFDATIDLSSLKFQNLTNSVAFRIYGWDSTSGSGITYIRNLTGDDLVVNGAVEAIPEPAVLGFIALVGIGSLVAKRFFE